MENSEPVTDAALARRDDPPTGGPVTFAAVRRAEAQRLAAERAAAEKTPAPVPARPSLAAPQGAPVLVKQRQPFSVALSRGVWVIGTVVGMCAATYLLIIRTAHLETVAERAKTVDGGRAADTYTQVAEIATWTLFGAIVSMLLVQVAAQVSYANRRANARWWMLGTIVFGVALYPVAAEMVAFGDRGRPLALLLAGHTALMLLGLLFSWLPGALRWTRRRVDIVPHPYGTAATVPAD
ncbi:hypothetical protein [Microbacterium sp. GXF7504]